jgi:uncharacterized protein YoaH (UPF0181 family)
MLNIFNPVVNQVIALVAQQVREANKHYHSIDVSNSNFTL